MNYSTSTLIIVDLNIQINLTSSTPIFQQIVKAYEELILTGKLKEGDGIPSIREFSVKHTVNPNTVSKSYQILQTMKLIEPSRGMGLFVGQIDPKNSKKRRLELMIIEVNSLTQLGKNLKFTAEEVIQLIEKNWKDFK